MTAQEILPGEGREIGRRLGDFMVAFGHPLTCNGGNPDWRSHHDHEVRMLRDGDTLVCPECGREQAIPEHPHQGATDSETKASSQ